MLLIMDNYSSHHFEWDSYRNWRKTKIGFVYKDETTFSNLTLLYLPTNSTGATQPADLGPNSFIQQKYQKSWNLTENKTLIGRGYKIGLAFDSVDLLDNATITHAWNSSKLTSLNTTSMIDAETINEIELADEVYGETLESECQNL